MTRLSGRQFYVEPDAKVDKTPDNSTRSGFRSPRRNNMANWRLERQRHVQGGRSGERRQGNSE